MSMTCDPIRMIWPNTRGHVRVLYRSDSMAMGGVAEPSVNTDIEETAPAPTNN